MSQLEEHIETTNPENIAESHDGADQVDESNNQETEPKSEDIDKVERETHDGSDNNSEIEQNSNIANSNEAEGNKEDNEGDNSVKDNSSQSELENSINGSENTDGEDSEDQSDVKEESGAEEEKKGPAFVPKDKRYYEHDDRALTSDEDSDKDQDESNTLKPTRRRQPRGEERWEHDLFILDKQGPKIASSKPGEYANYDSKARQGSRRDWQEYDDFERRDRQGNRGRGRPRGRGRGSYRSEDRTRDTNRDWKRDETEQFRETSRNDLRGARYGRGISRGNRGQRNYTSRNQYNNDTAVNDIRNSGREQVTNRYSSDGFEQADTNRAGNNHKLYGSSNSQIDTDRNARRQKNAKDKNPPKQTATIQNSRNDLKNHTDAEPVTQRNDNERGSTNFKTARQRQVSGNQKARRSQRSYDNEDRQDIKSFGDTAKRPSRYYDQSTKLSSQRNEKYQDKIRTDNRPGKKEPTAISDCDDIPVLSKDDESQKVIESNRQEPNKGQINVISESKEITATAVEDDSGSGLLKLTVQIDGREPISTYIAAPNPTQSTAASKPKRYSSQRRAVSQNVKTDNANTSEPQSQQEQIQNMTVSSVPPAVPHPVVGNYYDQAYIEQQQQAMFQGAVNTQGSQSQEQQPPEIVNNQIVMVPQQDIAVNSTGEENEMLGVMSGSGPPDNVMQPMVTGFFSPRHPYNQLPLQTGYLQSGGNVPGPVSHQFHGIGYGPPYGVMPNQVPLQYPMYQGGVIPSVYQQQQQFNAKRPSAAIPIVRPPGSHDERIPPSEI